MSLKVIGILIPFKKKSASILMHFFGLINEFIVLLLINLGFNYVFVVYIGMTQKIPYFTLILAFTALVKTFAGLNAGIL